MNKTVLGFIFGIGVVVAAAVGYMAANTISKSTQTAVEVSTPKAATSPIAATTTPATPKAPTTPVAATPAATSPVTYQRQISSGATYAPGVEFEVTINLAAAPSGETLRAVGLAESLPEGFTYLGVVGDKRPDVSPNGPRTGKIEFAWISVPTFPTSFTYKVKAAEDAAGQKDIRGIVLVRAGGPELRSPEVVTSLTTDGAAPVAPAPMPAPAEAAPPAPAVDAATAAATAAAATPATPAPPVPAIANEKLAEAMQRMREESEKPATPVEVARSIAAGSYTPGQPLEVSIQLSYAGQDAVSTLSLVETLPQGWTFDKISGGPAPGVAPPAGKTGALTFIWQEVPQFPIALTYVVVPAADSTGAKELGGGTVFRTTGGMTQGPRVVTTVEQQQ